MRTKPKHRVTKRTIETCVAISDTHCGCRLAIMGRDPVPLDEGGAYSPSKYQLRLADMWDEFWGEWVPKWTRGEPFCVVHNGDAIDGVHHGSTTQISHNLGDQRAIAFRLLKPIVELCEGRYYHIRGTEAHVGQSAVDEEGLAKDLGAVKNSDGQHARYDLWLSLGDRLVHFLHHIGVSGSTHYESSAVMSELAAEFTEAARWGERAPDVVVRSHRHRSIKLEIPTHFGSAIGLVTPAWQLKTAFAWRVAGARISTPQIGGSIIKRGDRAMWADSKVWHVTRSSIVTP
jgi:hypothetical protein